ncbi:endosomal peripheral membrane protein [Niveomyces insectorum RCEF 264]|uniref:Endosomal peripheral membrane protein n=1 Tax=Niveomyces insectorum RCEF 264 TaxID=1081102 RepID=A0A167SSM0_9HYPO|nr:endosomal peripheral membrane protein [Niveomyces insectorum RCEF 264]
MTAQLLASELSNLIQESKRKHNDLKQAAEKSLEELRSISDSSEAQIGVALSQRTNFVNPFVIACGTRNVKFTSIAIVCLQRLIAAKGVPRSRLDQVLHSLRDASSGGLDVQLRILQSLPSLLQNYANDVVGDLLITALNICFVLQASKNVVVNNTASATLQQLLIAVLDKVAAEDKPQPRQLPAAGEELVGETTIALRPAALDAYRVFKDICLLTESGRPEYLRFSNLPQTFGLELVESILTNHPGIFASHPEQIHILRSSLLPFLTKSLVGKPNFPTAVRLVRVLYTVLRRHMTLLPAESGEALAALTHVIDHDTMLWKRVLCLEAFKGIFFDPSLLRQIYMLYDAKADERNILQDLLATFVRVSTERPTVIGLGHQSTIPVAGAARGGGSSTDQAILEASGVSGIISGSVTGEGFSTGISSQWSTIRTPCIDQLDKAEPLTIPESYIYSLVLSCITSLSDGLAKFILPLTVPNENRNRKKALKQEARPRSPAPTQTSAAKEEHTEAASGTGLERSSSFKKNPVPVNPLTFKEHSLHAEVKAYADMIDRCWPAILATCSTFLYAALDVEYYHSLVRAFQRFTHVAGLLQLNTPRDAFLTTLGKAAVPPNVLTACLNAGARPMTPTSAGSDTPNTGIFGNARGLLSVDSLVSQTSASDKSQQPFASDPMPASINTRNLLCLRALLNLGIALGPTLESSWQIILETLQQADFVLFCSGKAAGRTPTAVRASDAQADAEASMLLANFGTEIKAVETAASRLFESMVDFPNAAFVEFVVATCGMLEKRPEASALETGDDTSHPHEPTSPERKETLAAGGSSSNGNTKLKAPVVKHKRVMSITTVPSSGHAQEDQFVLAKLGDIASINLERLLYTSPDISGWVPLTSELINTLGSAMTSPAVRMRAVETLVRFLLEAASAILAEKDAVRSEIQLRLLGTLRDALRPLLQTDRPGSVATHGADIDIHKVALDGLKSFLEISGEALVSGWTVVFEIIDSLFVESRPAAVPFSDGGPSEFLDRGLTTRSVRLIKPSFASLQLICSDFLPSLPNTCYLDLVSTLYKFCSQDDDLNVALTTVTFYWAISDFLHARNNNNAMAIVAAMEGGPSDAALAKLAYNTSHPGSGAALWMLLLLRLTAVTTDQRLELRNSAVQTLLRIIHAYGSNLSGEAWSVCIRSVIFRLFSATEDRLRGAIERGASKMTCAEWSETAVVIINGVSKLLASYLDVLVSRTVFASLWQELLVHFETMLDFQVLDVSTAVFGSLASILSKSDGHTRWSFNKEAVHLAWGLWSRGVPVPVPKERKTERENGSDKDKSSASAASEDNQVCLESWVKAYLEIEHLMRVDMDLARIEQTIRLLRDAMVLASPGSYANDIEYMTPLQSRILAVFKVVRTDVDGAPSAVINQLAEFVSMAFDLPGARSSNKRTFVAMSKESMAVLHDHIKQYAGGAAIFVSGAFSTALASLAIPITRKYRFPIATRSLPPWQVATNAALAILETTLPHLREHTVPRAAFQHIWDVIATIADGIIRADLDDLDHGDEGGGMTATAPRDDSVLAADQHFDLQAFRKLRELIIPAMGAAAIADTARRAYAEGLFRVSIVHPLAPDDAALIYGGAENNNSGNDGDGNAPNGSRQNITTSSLFCFNTQRRGRTIDPPPTKRATMSYSCLDELFALVAAYENTGNQPAIVVQPPTPRLPPGQEPTATTTPPGSTETEHLMHVRLAQTAAPYLILRCALTLRAYVADQPLRGHMPQPLSQRRELSRILRCLVDLKSEPDAILSLVRPGGDAIEANSEGREHLLRLYPLLLRAVQVAGTAGDAPTLALAGEALEALGTELGV